MKKKVSILLVALLIFMFLFQLKVNAAVIDLSVYQSEDLKTTLEEEGATGYDLAKYNQANDKRVNIYVFRKDGCINCKNLYKDYIVNVILPKYGDKVKITTYEVGTNATNFSLLNKCMGAIGAQSNVYATPTVIIGNKSFSGDFRSQAEVTKTQREAFEAEILALYQANTRYDVLEELGGKYTFSENTSKVTFTSNKRLDKNYILQVNPVNRNDVSLSDGYEYIAAYDIAMYDGTQEVSINQGTYTIKIPMDKIYDRYQVGYVNNGEIQETFDATYANEYITFTTTHLSEYVVSGYKVEDSNTPTQEPEEPTNPGSQGELPDDNQEDMPEAVEPDASGKTSDKKDPAPKTGVEDYTVLASFASLLSIVGMIVIKKRR